MLRVLGQVADETLEVAVFSRTGDAQSLVDA